MAEIGFFAAKIRGKLVLLAIGRCGEWWRRVRVGIGLEDEIGGEIIGDDASAHKNIICPPLIHHADVNVILHCHQFHLTIVVIRAAALRAGSVHGRDSKHGYDAPRLVCEHRSQLRRVLGLRDGRKCAKNCGTQDCFSH